LYFASDFKAGYKSGGRKSARSLLTRTNNEYRQIKGENKMFNQPSRQILFCILIGLLLITTPAYAVRNIKISNYAGGHQIWFEAEDFDERNPDTDQYYPVVDVADAFGQAITRTGGAGGMISWTFDISAAGGRAGTWYFWGRVLNPENRSDYMLVEGDPGDAEIPAGPPFPGDDGTAPFDNTDDRILEETTDPWGWWGNDEGSTKELHNGQNTMYIFHRQGNETGFWDVFMWADDPVYRPSDEDYLNAITFFPGTAFKPIPADGAVLEDTWVSLNWSPAKITVSHDVYFGENFNDVNDGLAETFRGNQKETFYIVGFPGFPYPEGLTPGTTYYWRIDEVNDADPDSPFKGEIWSFTVPSLTAYNPNPADNIELVDPNVELSWMAGLGSKLHHLYFGDNFEDVNAGIAETYEGPVSGTTYSPASLDLDKVYYWRVDEFAIPDTYKGQVWSFKTIPEVPITDPHLLGWWKLDEGAVVFDWSGHGNNGTLEGDPQWVAGYDGDALDLDGMGDNVNAGSVQLPVNAFTFALWFNSGSVLNSSSTRRDFLYWQSGDRPHLTFNRSGTGEIGLWPAIEGDFDGPLTTTTSWDAETWYHIAATFDGTTFRIYVNGNLESELTHPGIHDDASGLLIGCRTNRRNYFDGKIDDVRLYDTALAQDEIQLVMRGDPMAAWNPNPANGSIPYIKVATPLSWSPGDNASEHDVYFGTDRDAVSDADVSDTTGIYRGRQMVTNYNPTEVEWAGGPYYWRVDEINTDGTISKGRTWSFTVRDFIEIDGFESYNDINEGEPGSNRIYLAWIDGFDNPAINGSIVGHANPPFAEQTIVHSGRQSMPLFYDNGVGISEATMTLTNQRDWTEEGVGVLSLWFYGDASNAAEPMFVALNGNAVVTHDNPDAALIDIWTRWTIDLSRFADQGVSLVDVNTITIGFGNKSNPVTGGSGMVFFDDIRLYRPVP
jgi:hypothetical protein